MFRRRVRRGRSGTYELRIGTEERDVLRTLPGQLRELLVGGDRLEDPALRRLYPAAHLDDPAAAAEFDELAREELTAGRMEAIDTMLRTIDAPSLTGDELAAWLGAINDLRLMLGVRLAVTEESAAQDFAGDPEAEGTFELYGYLSMLEEEIVEALSDDVEGAGAFGAPPVV
jgi:hypothetical protein